MSSLIELVDSWFDLHAQHGPRDDVRQPGATDTQIAEVEAAVGFEMIEPLRDLYRYSNGAMTWSPYDECSFIPGDFAFVPLDGLVYYYPSNCLTANEFLTHGPCGVPGILNVESAGPFVTRGLPMGVQCGSVGTGAIWWLDNSGDFGWQARSLTDLFEYMHRRFDAGILEWNDRGVQHRMGARYPKDSNPDAPNGEQWPFEAIEFAEDVAAAITQRPLFDVRRATVLEVSSDGVTIVDDWGGVPMLATTAHHLYPVGSDLRVGDAVHHRLPLPRPYSPDRPPEIFYRFPRPNGT